MKKIDIQVKRLAHAADLPLPAYQSELAAGLDLLAAIPHDAPMVLAPGEHAMVPTGLCMALPSGTAFTDEVLCVAAIHDYEAWLASGRPLA